MAIDRLSPAGMGENSEGEENESLPIVDVPEITHSQTFYYPHSGEPRTISFPSDQGRRELQDELERWNTKKREDEGAKEKKISDISEQVRRIIDEDQPFSDFASAFSLSPETDEVFSRINPGKLTSYLESKLSNISEEEFSSTYGLFRYGDHFFYSIIQLLGKRSSNSQLAFGLFGLLINKEKRENRRSREIAKKSRKISGEFDVEFDWLLDISEKLEEILTTAEVDNERKKERFFELMVSLSDGPNNKNGFYKVDTGASVLFDLAMDTLFLRFQRGLEIIDEWQDSLIGLSSEFYDIGSGLHYDIDETGKFISIHEPSFERRYPFWRADDEHRATYVGKEIISRAIALDEADNFIARLASEYITRHQNRRNGAEVYDPENLLGRNPETIASWWEQEDLEAHFAANPESRPDKHRESRFWDNFELAPGDDENYWIYVDTPEADMLDHVVKCLGKSDGERSLTNVLDLAGRFEYSVLARSFANALQEKDLTEASGGLLRLIESEPVDSHKKFLLGVLFRLELGRVGISEDGLDYLGRRFDLGEFNDSANFVQRITADGKVGIFDAERNLEGFVQLGPEDFQQKTESDAIRKEVLAITTEMLFTPRADDTEEDESHRKSLLQEFVSNYYGTYIVGFRERTGVQFNNLSLQEQGWALSYLTESGDRNKDQFYDLVKKHGENALKAFIAVEYGSDMGNQILELSESLPEMDIAGFFDSFSGISSAAEELSQIVAEMSERSDMNLEFIKNQLFEAITRKTKDFVTAARQSVTNPEETKFSEVLGSMKEFRFVLQEVINALRNEGKNYQIIEKQTNQREGSSTYLIRDSQRDYQINLVLRPQETESTVTDNKTGERKKLQLHPGIRATFIWPNKRRFGIRLDLDPYYSDHNFPHGRLSLDIGSRDSLIAGILDRTSEQGHHNIASFSPKLSEPETFSQLCLNFESYLDRLDRITTP